MDQKSSRFTFSFLASSLLCGIALFSLPRCVEAEAILYSSMDNAFVGAGMGADTTADGPFDVLDQIGGANGLAGGSAQDKPGATTGAPLTSGATGIIGQAISLPGTQNAGVNYGKVHDPGTGDYSVSLWFNLQGDSNNDAYFASKGNLGINSAGWSIFYQKDFPSIKFRVGMGGGGNDNNAAVRTDNLVVDSDWHHLAMVIDSSAQTVSGYFDGEPALNQGGGGTADGTFVYSAEGIVSSWPLLLGVGAGGGQNMPGLLDDFVLYNTALSAVEVDAIYKQGLDGIPAVPEPSAALLGALGLALLSARRRSHGSRKEV